MADLNEILKQVNSQMTETYQPDYEKLKQQQATEKAALDAERNRQQQILDSSLFKANQNAYITKQQTTRDMPGQLAAQGIKGGANETTLSDIYNTYLNARNAAKSSYDESTGKLGSNYNTSIASLGTKYAQLMAALDSEKRTQALTVAQQKYQQALADEAAAAAAASAAESSGGSSGGSGTTETVSAPKSYTNSQTNYAGGSSAKTGKIKDIVNFKEWDGSKFVNKKMIYYEDGTTKKMNAQ